MTGLAAIILITTGFVAIGELPASASSSSSYVALGDSYAAGVGTPLISGPLCIQGAAGYPTQLVAAGGLAPAVNRACAGATLADVVTYQLPALPPGTSVVTVTVGGNDLNVSGVAAACATDPTAVVCQTAIATATATLNSSAFTKGLYSTLSKVAQAAPGARIVVTGYPYLFDWSLTTDPVRGSAVKAINQATTVLNAKIALSVVALKFQRVNIAYADVSIPFLKHGIGSADPWINTNPTDAGIFHPTAVGYAAYAAAVRSKL